MRSIGGLFGKSPFSPLQEHIAKIRDSVRCLQPLFESIFETDEGKFAGIVNDINRFEQEADEIKNELRDNMPRSLFMPVARPDLLVLLDVQDGIADTAQDIGVLLNVRKPKLPDNFKENLMKLVEYAIRSTDQVAHLYEKIFDLLESTFRGKPAQDALDEIEQIGKTEHKADKVALQLLDQLYNRSENLPYHDFMIWDKVMVKLSHIADLARKTSNRLRIILAK